MVMVPASDPEMLSGFRRSCSTSSALDIRSDDLAVLDHVVPVGQRATRSGSSARPEGRCSRLSLSLRITAPICWTITGARPSVGSSSSRSVAPVRRMRPMASICCSPPESLRARAAPAFLEVREELKISSTRHAARRDDGRQQEVLLDAEAGEDRRAPPGNRRCRGARRTRAAGRGFPGRRSGSSRSCLRISPMIERSVVVLPAPLRPSRVTISPFLTSKLSPCSALLSPYQAWRSRTSR